MPSCSCSLFCQPVQTPREAVKDAENIKLLSELQRQRMQSYDLNLVRFMPGEFAENLVSGKVHQHVLVQYAHTCMCARKDCASAYLCTLTSHTCIINNNMCFAHSCGHSSAVSVTHCACKIVCSSMLHFISLLTFKKRTNCP